MHGSDRPIETFPLILMLPVSAPNSFWLRTLTKNRILLRVGALYLITFLVFSLPLLFRCNRQLQTPGAYAPVLEMRPWPELPHLRRAAARHVVKAQQLRGRHSVRQGRSQAFVLPGYPPFVNICG